MSQTSDARRSAAGIRCSFCGYEIPDDPVPSGAAGTELFCSTACRAAFAEGETPFAGRHWFKRPRTGVAVLDSLLPQGYRADSFVLLRGAAGTRRGELQLELVWRALQRGEPVAVVSFVDPPTAFVERFLALGWNVLPYLDRGQLHVVDCFTRRLSDPDQFDGTRSAWTDHAATHLADAVTTMRNPDDLRELEGRINDVVDELEMMETGLVVIDSLEEIGTLVSDAQVENFLKEIRAEVCKNRFVPVVASRCTDRSMAPQQQQMRVTSGGLTTDLTYFADGIVDFRTNEEIVPDTRLNQVSVRKMRGVRFLPQWLTYALGPDGLASFDPRTQTATVYDPQRLAAQFSQPGGNVPAPGGSGPQGPPRAGREPGPGQPAAGPTPQRSQGAAPPSTARASAEGGQPAGQRPAVAETGRESAAERPSAGTDRRAEPVETDGRDRQTPPAGSGGLDRQTTPAGSDERERPAPDGAE